MKTFKHPWIVFLLLASLLTGISGFAAAAESAAQLSPQDVEKMATMVINSSELVTEGFKAFYARHEKAAKDFDELINAGFLKEYPKTTHASSDFYGAFEVLDDGGSQAYFIRYSFGEPDAEAICQKINEIKLGLNKGAPVSATSVRIVDGTLYFAPPPVEIVNKPAYCLKNFDHFEYFHRVMSRSL